MPRTLLKPAELVKIFLGAVERNWCEGLFITTGIPGRPSAVVGEVIQVLELLRLKHRFTGYIHVKLVVGSDQAQIERVTALANRVSLNLETPCGASLTQIAPEKDLSLSFQNLEKVRSLVAEERAERRYGRPVNPLRPQGASGITTQFVVGATPDADKTILNTVSRLHKGGEVHHVHFSAFRPIIDTPMENVAGTPVLREHRLYQAEYLLRDYHFKADEIVFGPDGNLPLARDPKVAWALDHPEKFPVEVNKASIEELIRVPGIGKISATRIVTERKTTTFRSASDLQKLGIRASHAAGFLTLNGKRLQHDRWIEQLGMWSMEEQVGVNHRTYQVSPGTFR
jgi:predicted DNA-binding helix-hairpin-helix protein